VNDLQTYNCNFNQPAWTFGSCTKAYCYGHKPSILRLVSEALAPIGGIRLGSKDLMATVADTKCGICGKELK
jgi:hypothetical protein